MQWSVLQTHTGPFSGSIQSEAYGVVITTYKHLRNQLFKQSAVYQNNNIALTKVKVRLITCLPVAITIRAADSLSVNVRWGR